jgi:uncharacterized protein YpbB
VDKAYFSLKDKLDINKIGQSIQQLLKTNTITADSILEIGIKTVTYNDHSMIPKIEYKEPKQ